jgi:DNA-binding transcriptional ArsR family regulator
MKVPNAIARGKMCDRATEIAALLKLVANEPRLLLLCRLSAGEASVGEMVGLCNQSQSSVSQHLAKMRENGLVCTRREGTTIYYSIANPHADALIAFLCDQFGDAVEDG